MKKFITVFLISVLLLSTLPVTAKASSLNEHEYYMQYDSYGKRLYEYTVETTAYVSGALTDNQSYIEEIKQDIKQHASDSWDFIRFNPEEYDHVYGVFEYALDKGGALVLTATDWLRNNLKGFFSKQEVEPIGSLLVSDNRINFQDGSVNFKFKKDGGLLIPRSYVDVLSYKTTNDVPYVILNFPGGQSGLRSIDNVTAEIFYTEDIATFCHVFNSYVSPNVSYTCIPWIDGKEQPIYKAQSPINSTINNYFDNDYITNETQTSDKKPNEIIIDNFQPILICNEQIKKMTFMDNGFYYNGQSVQLDENGQIMLDGVLCSLDFQTPIIQYDEKGEPVSIDSEGNKTNLITGESDEIPLPECDGVLCWVSNIFKSIGGLAKSIGSLASTVINLVTNLIDALFYLIVPENLDFITDLFDSLKTTFTEKFAIATDIQNLFKSIFTESTTNPLTDLSFTLPATDTELSFSVFAVVDDYVPMIKRIISALLALMTLTYVYRKITGSGGVMEK